MISVFDYRERTLSLLTRALKLADQRRIERSAARSAVTALKGTKAQKVAVRQLMMAETLEWRALRRVAKEAGSHVYAVTKGKDLYP